MLGQYTCFYALCLTLTKSPLWSAQAWLDLRHLEEWYLCGMGLPSDVAHHIGGGHSQELSEIQLLYLKYQNVSKFWWDLSFGGDGS